MTQADKELLLKDLCARLPYGIKAKIKYYDGVWELLAIYTNGTTYATRDVGYPIETCFEECKPYLFPLSSMTEEQKEKALSLLKNCDYYLIDGVIKWLDNCPIEFFDWCNKNHFDYRGLIPMGLANDATGLNIY